MERVMTLKTLETAGIVYVEELRKIEEKIFIVDEVYALLEKAYSSVKGGLHFSGKDDLILTTDLWRLIYNGTKLIGIVIYKAKRGLKMVALGVHEDFKTEAKAVLSKMLKRTIAKSWMEVSENVEHFMLKLGCEKFRLQNSCAAALTQKEILSLCDDGYHYVREINGIRKTKVIIGFPK